jgi:hypothetical protein
MTFLEESGSFSEEKEPKRLLLPLGAVSGRYTHIIKNQSFFAFFVRKKKRLLFRNHL